MYQCSRIILDIVAHGLKLSVKLWIISKGLVRLRFAMSCLCGKGKNREEEKEEARKAGRQQEGRQMLL